MLVHKPSSFKQQLSVYLGDGLWTETLLSACTAVSTELSSGNESDDTDSTHSINELSSLPAAAALSLHSHTSQSIHSHINTTGP